MCPAGAGYDFQKLTKSKLLNDAIESYCSPATRCIDELLHICYSLNFSILYYYPHIHYLTN